MKGVSGVTDVTEALDGLSQRLKSSRGRIMQGWPC